MDDTLRGGPLPPIGILLDQPLEKETFLNSQNQWQKIVQLGYKFYYLASSQLGGVKPEALDELKRIALTLSQELHGFEQHNKAPYLRHGLEMPPPLPTMDFPTVATPPPQYKQTPDREPKERAFVIADLSDVNQTKKRRKRTLPPKHTRECAKCGATKTPEWRRFVREISGYLLFSGPNNATLCNACGKKRTYHHLTLQDCNT